ncbi:MAG: DUF3348 family protein [Polaromonas sp.]|nr:DUF3348 family protein [Polaromonas sp.]
MNLLGELDQAGDAAPVTRGQTASLIPEGPDPADHAGGHDTAESLSRWVGVFEAGTLHAALQQVAAASTVAPVRARAGTALPLRDQLAQVRALLARAITSPDTAAGATGRGRQRLDPPVADPDAATDFAPWRQRYQDVQRNMDLMIPPLRDHVRQTLAAATPGLRQLAALDAVWEQLLAGREQKLMASIPSRLKRRFDRLRKLHGQDRDTGAEDTDITSDMTQTDKWLDKFGQDLQQVLLAELDARLEPVTGLIEAFEQEG